MALDYRPQIVVAPGIVILEARKLDKDGEKIKKLINKGYCCSAPATGKPRERPCFLA